MGAAPTRQAGFTLIEVLIAIVLMAVVSMICWRALDNVTRTSAHLDQSTEQSRALLRAMQQFELDIAERATVELPDAPARQDGSAPALDADGMPMPEQLLPVALTTWRQAQAPFRIEIVRAAQDAPGQWQRVYWWRERNTLYRATAQPGSDFPLPAPDTADAVALLDDVQTFEVRAWRPGAGWTRLPDASRSAPATGLEMTLVQRTARGDAAYRRVLPLR